MSIKNQGGTTLKQKLQVITHGEPSLDGYSNSEKAVFYTTLYARIAELAKGGK